MFLLVRIVSGMRVRLLYCALLLLCTSSCGGGGDDSQSHASFAPGSVVVAAVRAGASPFIAFVDLEIPAALNLASVQYSIAQKPGMVSRPVSVSYALDYLARRGYVSAAGDGATETLTVPVFGLYSGYANQVAVQLQLTDGLAMPLQVAIVTPNYSDPSGIYDRPDILKSRTGGDTLGFDYFYMKSNLGGPVVVDTDGQIRWAVPGIMASGSSLLYENGFVIGDQTSLALQRLELDGAQTNMLLSGAADLTNFHHNIDPGKEGLLGELDATENGVSIIETRLAEFDPGTGEILKQWDLADTLSRYMSAQGDDPTTFVRPGVDWFHMNSAIYDASDDTLIVSSRENFVVKIDYDSGDLIWVFGDPTKYWHEFPSLVAKSLSLAAGALYPVGQHALSIAHDGSLLLFNDGLGSVNQPAGKPAGESRTFSTVSDFSINAASQSAVEAWRFDYGQSIFSEICSSAYEAASNASVLVSYAVADGGTHARLVGLDAGKNVIFDFQYATTECNTSWNAQPIAFDAMSFQ